MQLFYNSEISKEMMNFSFDKEESRHIVKVLRKKSGDKLLVTNGLGDVFTVEIISANDHKCTVKVVAHEKQQPKNYHLHLAVAPTKMNDRYEWFLEKATEIGISEITPIICDHSERSSLKAERMGKVILSAMKQSMHYYMPRLNEPMTFSDFMQTVCVGQKFIAHCEDDQKSPLKNVLQKNQDVTILIGPEGDFSSKEIKSAIENEYVPISLGETRLRTETAAIVATHSVVFINE
jgi:16S rRNA (uracil1498-N3)-methyltransferase